MAPRNIKPGTFVLDSGGIGQLLKSDEVATMIHVEAEQVAGHVRAALAGKSPSIGQVNYEPTAEGVVVTDYVTDRAASSVAIVDLRARIYQARDGVLTGACAASGLEVVQR